MSIEEIIGFVTGALCVWLAVRQNVWTFPIGLANNAVYVILFASTGLYAGAGLQVVYLVLGALGWYWWVRGGEAHRALTVRRTPAWVWPAAAVGAAAATALLVWVLSTWTDSTVPFWDALTTSTSLVAQLMLGRKWVGSWWVWIVTDVMLVGLYASQGLWLTAVLYVGFIGLCALGLRDWSAELRAGTHTGTGAGTPTEPDGAAPAARQDAR
ncbi:nicotinamide riboside transporter PnuC [Oerskovia enterophila]|uniref:Nicotinamide riboside transporter PnuC n=1 Tax=Oerskovia enterophila TaxID=43678 RepID=A0A161YGQ1_9CELL|nr:nicotinamide riboside transporter PnuC [Oerskovia enterophila]KZM35208.1 nicotinamide riboside transporter PnuC [Oerskovia enterophila]